MKYDYKVLYNYARSMLLTTLEEYNWKVDKLMSTWHYFLFFSLREQNHTLFRHSDNAGAGSERVFRQRRSVFELAHLSSTISNAVVVSVDCVPPPTRTELVSFRFAFIPEHCAQRPSVTGQQQRRYYYPLFPLYLCFSLYLFLPSGCVRFL